MPTNPSRYLENVSVHLGNQIGFFYVIEEILFIEEAMLMDLISPEYRHTVRSWHECREASYPRFLQLSQSRCVRTS